MYIPPWQSKFPGKASSIIMKTARHAARFPMKIDILILDLSILVIGNSY